jgi:toluene monooxygenase system ferredoxin subunit
MAFLKIATLDDVWSGEMIGVAVDGISVLLINVEGTVHAYIDACPHLGTPLSRGSLRETVLTCATHQWQFDAQTGCGINPLSACLEPLSLKIQGDEILLDLETLKHSGERQSNVDA